MGLQIIDGVTSGVGLVRTEKLNKYFGRVHALRDVTITIGGGITGVIGPNGAGKTTLMNIVVGLVRPSSGEVEVFGMDPWSEGSMVRDRLGLLLEDMELPRRFTGRRFIKFLSDLYGVSMDSLMDMVRYFEMEYALDREISTYSAGMLKRMGLINAFANPEAELVILDEPSANLDIGSRLKVMDYIKQIRRKRNVVIASHILPELEEVCDWVILINRGRVVESKRLAHYYEAMKPYRYVVTSNNNEALYRLLEGIDTIDNYWVEGGRIGLETKEPNKTLRILVETAEQNGIEIYEFKPAEDILTRIFREKIYSEQA